MKEINKMNQDYYKALEKENKKLKMYIRGLLKTMNKTELADILHEIKFLKRDWLNDGKFVLR